MLLITPLMLPLRLPSKDGREVEIASVALSSLSVALGGLCIFVLALTVITLENDIRETRAQTQRNCEEIAVLKARKR